MALMDADDMLEVTDVVCKQIMSASMAAIGHAGELMGQLFESYKAAKGPLQKQLVEILKEHAIKTFDLAVDRADRVGAALIEAYGRDDKHKARVRKWQIETNAQATGAKLWAQYEEQWKQTHEENPNLN